MPRHGHRPESRPASAPAPVDRKSPPSVVASSPPAPAAPAVEPPQAPAAALASPQPAPLDVPPSDVALPPAPRLVATVRIFAGHGVEYAPGAVIPAPVAAQLVEGLHWRTEV